MHCPVNSTISTLLVAVFPRSGKRAGAPQQTRVCWGPRNRLSCLLWQRANRLSVRASNVNCSRV